MMKLTKSRIVALATVGGLSMVLSMSLSTQAHTASDWFPASWGSNHLTVDWRYVDDVPAAKRPRIQDGSQEWNALNQSMTFHFESAQSDYPASFTFLQCPALANAEKDAVHWGPIDGSAVGSTVLCTFQDAGGSDNNSLHSFQIKFDSTVTWYTGTGTPGSTEVDLWSLAAHEFGHATGRGKTFGGKATVGGDGFGHFLDSSSLCNVNEADHHTMCQTNIATGQNWDRSLNTHDKDTFNNKY